MSGTPLENPMDCASCHVRRMALFSPMGEDQLTAVQGVRRHQELLPSGASLYREGKTVTQAYTVFEGWVMRYKTLEDGRRQIIGYALPGDFLGFVPLTNCPVSHSAETLTPATLCTFGIRDLLDMFPRFPDLALYLCWKCGREEASAIEHLTSLGRRPARERIAHLLLELDYRIRARNGLPTGESITLPLTQEHIADTLGLTSIHVSRTLRTLREEGLLELRSGRLTFGNRQALVRLTGFQEHNFQAHPML
jgi:CRP-like cAMP-binding protein